MAVFGVGLFIRFVLAPISADPDLESFAEGSLGMYYGSPPYATGLVYPPAWVLLLNLIGRSTAAIASPGSLIQLLPALTMVGATSGVTGLPVGLASPLYSLVEKTPLFVFDALTGLILYQVVLERTGRLRPAQLVVVGWFLNPLVIVESAVHGAFDVLPVFFMALALYCVPRGQVLTAGAALGLAVSLKGFPLLLLPLFVVLVYRLGERNLNAAIRREGIFGIGVASTILATIWPPSLLEGFAERVVLPQGGPISALPTFYGGFGPWAFASYPGFSGVEVALGARTAIVVPLLIATAIAVVAFIAYRVARSAAALDEDRIWRAAALSTTAILLAVPYVQPQYLLWILPFYLVVVVLNRRDVALVWGITVLASLYALLAFAGPYSTILPLYFPPPHTPPPYVVQSLQSWPPFSSWVGFATTLPASALLGTLVLRLLRTPRSRGIPG
ncbi:MAG: hypothetical protein L3K15_07145 [Thermoplasmata archaeon]|nr:hypothetical protein [Thermoplasmata archaeon]